MGFRGIHIALMAVLLAPGRASNEDDEEDPKIRTVRFKLLHEIVEEISTSAGEAHILFLVEPSPEAAELAGALEDSPPDRGARVGLSLMDGAPSLVVGWDSKRRDLVHALRQPQARTLRKGKIDLAGNLRRAAGLFDSVPGKKVLVLFLSSLPDVETALENAVAFLVKRKVAVHTISGEALYGNPPWTPDKPAARDSAYIEFPSGWILSDVEPLHTIASGFAPYSLRRIAGATAGINFLYDPGRDPLRFCDAVGCLYCAGAHRRCGAPLDEGAMKLLAPFAGSRKDHRLRVAVDPLWKAVFAAWIRAFEAGIVGSPPPLSPAGAERPRKDPPPARLRFRIPWANEVFAAKLMAGAVERLWRDLRKRIAKYREKADPRALATAEALSFYLRTARFNLYQLALFCEEQERAGKGKRRYIGFGRRYFDLPASSVVGYTYECLPLCHLLAEKSWPAPVELLGDGKERDALLTVGRKLIAGYRGTPWELLVRHANLVAFFPVGGEGKIPLLPKGFASIKMPSIKIPTPKFNAKNWPKLPTPSVGSKAEGSPGSNQPPNVPKPGSQFGGTKTGN